jgi:predicted Kef-type K+ transport protein
VALASNDVFWVVIAFLFGFLAKLIGLPPLTGFLSAGLLLSTIGYSSGETLEKLADLGITLLLFTVGLKLNIRTLLKPQIWAVASLHLSTFLLISSGIIYLLAISSIPYFENLNLFQSVVLAFALSFSSTVFAVKVLEEKGEMRSFHGRISIGILIMQDLIAVAFLAISTAKFPSIWALALLLFLPLRPLFALLLKKTGHGELMILFGFVLALGSAELFELVGIKGDFGALVCGVFISSIPKAKELAKAMLSFKDLFLIGFFLSIGMSAELTWHSLLIALLFVPAIFFKAFLFYLLMTGFNLRARTSVLSSFSLTNYSEFGLIVLALSASLAWIDDSWLAILSISLTVSFVIAALLNKYDDTIYSYLKPLLIKFEKNQRLADDALSDIQCSAIVIFGMGRVGTGAYKHLKQDYGNAVIGIDFDKDIIQNHLKEGRKVLHGDPSDADFWEKIHNGDDIELVMLALPNLKANLQVLQQLKRINFYRPIAAIAKFPDDEKVLLENGASEVFNFYTEVGAGFAEHIEKELAHKTQALKTT